MVTRNRTESLRLRRKRAIRKRLHGTTERPRMVVFRSLSHIYVQVVDDGADEGVGRTLAAASSLTKDLAEQLRGKKKREAAQVVGEWIGKQCLEKGIQKVVFDRNGFLYHGRVSAVAEGARKAGLAF
jgi:large subunit ribosomal protein L18